MSFLQINYWAVVKNYFDCFQIKFTENRMKIVKTQMRDINLNFVIFTIFIWVLSTVFIFLFYFEKAFFNFFFDLRLQLLLHIEHFQILTFKIFQWMTYFTISVLIIFIDRFRNIEVCFCRVIIWLARWIYHWQLFGWRLICFVTFLVLVLNVVWATVRSKYSEISTTIILKVTIHPTIKYWTVWLVVDIGHLSPAIGDSIHLLHTWIILWSKHSCMRLTILHHNLFIDIIYLLLKKVSFGLEVFKVVHESVRVESACEVGIIVVWSTLIILFLLQRLR